MANSKATAAAAAALCFLILSSSFISSADSASCCMRYTRRPIQCEEVLGYTIQPITGSCDINAVILHLPGRFLCANPFLRKTQKLTDCVDSRMRELPQVYNAHDTAATPPSTSAPTN